MSKRYYVCIIGLIGLFLLIDFVPQAFAQTYHFPWPGILPDNKLYKIKVMRNKIIEKMILSPMDKMTFDLLMADKTIYASNLLFNKGEISLSKDTALKGENYFSMLVMDYNKSLLQNKKIPRNLDRKIDSAVVAHQEIFKALEERAGAEDKKTFEIVINFSNSNYRFIQGLRDKKNNAR